jgi:hypothetical protein
MLLYFSSSKKWKMPFIFKEVLLLKSNKLDDLGNMAAKKTLYSTVVSDYLLCTLLDDFAVDLEAISRWTQ